jgi:putative addiction module component (TIGR02574 family)
VSLADFESQLLSLPEADRIHLVEVLWESLASEDLRERTRQWAAEAERRLDAVQSGQLPLVDAGQVFQALRTKPRR